MLKKNWSMRNSSRRGDNNKGCLAIGKDSPSSRRNKIFRQPDVPEILSKAVSQRKGFELDSPRGAIDQTHGQSTKLADSAANGHCLPLG
jgi:hypothetical protein